MSDFCFNWYSCHANNDTNTFFYYHGFDYVNTPLQCLECYMHYIRKIYENEDVDFDLTKDEKYIEKQLCNYPFWYKGDSDKSSKDECKICKTKNHIRRHVYFQQLDSNYDYYDLDCILKVVIPNIVSKKMYIFKQCNNLLDKNLTQVIEDRMKDLYKRFLDYLDKK